MDTQFLQIFNLYLTTKQMSGNFLQTGSCNNSLKYKSLWENADKLLGCNEMGLYLNTAFQSSPFFFGKLAQINQVYIMSSLYGQKGFIIPVKIVEFEFFDQDLD